MLHDPIALSKKLQEGNLEIAFLILLSLCMQMNRAHHRVLPAEELIFCMVSFLKAPQKRFRWHADG